MRWYLGGYWVVLRGLLTCTVTLDERLLIAPYILGLPPFGAFGQFVLHLFLESINSSDEFALPSDFLSSLHGGTFPATKTSLSAYHLQHANVSAYIGDRRHREVSPWTRIIRNRWSPPHQGYTNLGENELEMCFYDQKTFICGDFKWIHFRLQCPAEHRTGETCGLKLIMSTIYVNQKCERCDRLQMKTSRFWKTEQRIMRWKMSDQYSEDFQLGITQSRTASIDVSKRVLEGLRRDILNLQDKRAFPFASLDCEMGPNFEVGNAASDDKRNDALPCLKIFAISSSSLPDVNKEDELLRPGSNIFILKLLESEAFNDIEERNGDTEKSSSIPIDGQEQERLAFILTMRLFYVAYEALISSEGTFRLPSGIILSALHYPEISPSIFEYIQALKSDLLHAGLTSQLAEADAEIEGWLPGVIEALRNPQSSMQDAPRQLQRLLATLREIQARIRCSGFREVQHVPLTEEQEQQLMLENLRASHDASPTDESPLGYRFAGPTMPRIIKVPRQRTARPAG